MKRIELVECRHCKKEYNAKDMLEIELPRHLPKIRLIIGTKRYPLCQNCAMKIYSYVGDAI